jgi:transcriptional regulator with XRE-family HTH domain
MRSGNSSGTMGIGNNVRLIRASRGLTGRQLAERIGVSPSYLSKLERGTARLSVDLVRSISSVLHVVPGDLLTPGLNPATGSVRPAGDCVVSLIRAAERKILRVPKYPYDYHLLTPYGRGQLELSWAELAPGTGDPEPKIHGESEEAIVLLGGVLHVTVGGDEFELYPGDCITYSSAMPHACRNDGLERAFWIWAATPPTL